MSRETDTIEKMLSELRVIAESPLFPKTNSGVPEMPAWISSGDDESLIINRKISLLIVDLSDQLYAQKPALSKAISARDWYSNVQRVLGPILGKTDLELPISTSAEFVLIALNNALNYTDWNYKSRTFLFGCSLLQLHDIQPFEVGPVTISSRSSWTNHALKEGRITRVTHRRLSARWAGKKMRSRKTSVDSLNEKDILDAIGEAPYVCAVQTDGLFGEFAKDKALLAARLTLLGVSMMWENPSKALKEINLVYDGPAYRQTYIYFQDNPEIFGGSKWVNSLHGVSLFNETWEQLVVRHRNLWIILSEIIKFLLSDVGHAARPALMNNFAHALIWFHEACREPMPMIAITKYVSSLDALAGGHQDYGISQLVAACLGVDSNSLIRPGGPSFKSAIKELYSQGRSRLLHGTSNRIGEDWEYSRGLSETLARLCLVTCFEWAVNHPDCDEPKNLLKA